MSNNYKKSPEPSYYKGKVYGYTARKVVDDFELSSWTAQAVQYILSAGKKDKDKHIEDIQKAINVLHFELDRIYNLKNKI